MWQPICWLELGLLNPQLAGSAQVPILLRHWAHGPKRCVTLTLEGFGATLLSDAEQLTGLRATLLQYFWSLSYSDIQPTGKMMKTIFWQITDNPKGYVP